MSLNVGMGIASLVIGNVTATMIVVIIVMKKAVLPGLLHLALALPAQMMAAVSLPVGFVMVTMTVEMILTRHGFQAFRVSNAPEMDAVLEILVFVTETMTVVMGVTRPRKHAHVMMMNSDARNHLAQMSLDHVSHQNGFAMTKASGIAPMVPMKLTAMP